MFSPQGCVCLVGLGACGLLYVDVFNWLPGSILECPIRSTAWGTPLENTSWPQQLPDGLYTLFLEEDPKRHLILRGLFLQWVLEDIDGLPKDLAEFAGHVSVVMNISSLCGFTETNKLQRQASRLL